MIALHAKRSPVSIAFQPHPCRLGKSKKLDRKVAAVQYDNNQLRGFLLVGSVRSHGSLRSLRSHGSHVYERPMRPKRPKRPKRPRDTRQDPKSKSDVDSTTDNE